MNFIPFDIKCYNKLYEKFQTYFEPELINEICGSGKLRHIDADEELINVGMVITHMPLVISGSVRVMMEDKEGDELLLYYLELGDTCAVTLNCSTRKARSSIRAIAETDVEILFVPIEKMDQWMIKYKSWRGFVLNSYNERLNEMLAALDNIVFHSLEERLEKYLNDKALIANSATLHISHQEIANELHSSRVVVSRLMKKLEKRQLINQLRNKVILLKFPA